MSVVSAQFTAESATEVSAAIALPGYEGASALPAPGPDASSGVVARNPSQGEAPQDAHLYLRHIQNGESIRALARETGCHPSTILRRIRRFENRRDDPLVDRALDQSPGAGSGGWSRNDHDQARRILRRLAEPGAELMVADAMEKAIVTRGDIRTAILTRELAQKLALRGWVTLIKPGRVTRHALSASGRAALRDMTMRRRGGVPGYSDFADAEPVADSACASPHAPPSGLAEAPAAFDHADQHRVWESRDVIDPETGERRQARFNLNESPMMTLARRRDANGRPFLDPGHVAAGERLREDFEMAQMGQRVTQNWDRFLTAGSDRGWRGNGFGGGSDSARDRVAAALRDLGPGMGDLVLRVCCFLEGIEMTERRLGWPSRSAKIVLRLALCRLERHYAESYGQGSRMIG